MDVMPRNTSHGIFPTYECILQQCCQGLNAWDSCNVPCTDPHRQSTLKRSGLSMFKDPKFFGCDISSSQFNGQLPWRLIGRLGGELESPPVHGDGLATLQILMNLDRFGRINMNRAHEPTRFVGPDGDQCQIDRRESLSDIHKVL